ncbi:MAG: Hsp20/alpha crystallin family protein [Anaerolineae bacterium]
MALTDLVPWKWGEKNVPVKREETDPFYTLHREMDRLFDDFMGHGFGLTRFGNFMDRAGAFNPQVDVTENDKEIKVAAELPGLDEKDIEVSLSGDMLTISGEKKAEKEDQRENYYRMERSYGSFQRSIALPVEVDTDKVEATFKNGVLQITLPKLHPGQEAKKRISIKTS